MGAGGPCFRVVRPARMGEAAAGGFTQAGSIVRLKFTNFMQVNLVPKKKGSLKLLV